VILRGRSTQKNRTLLFLVRPGRGPEGTPYTKEQNLLLLFRLGRGPEGPLYTKGQNAPVPV